MKRFLISFFLLFVVPQTSRSQVFTLSGTVRDAATGELLAAANIRVDGTTKGTIANADGGYKLSLDHGTYSLLFSYVGYKTDTLRIDLSGHREYHTRLQPTPILFSEVVVTDEDPAIQIMRKVIENKKRWSDALKSYQFDAFTRQVLRRDTAIASITESYTTGYWQAGDTLREVVKQKRQTENIPGTSNVAAVGGIVNFYEDEIRFGGFRFVGPTAPDAFDYYDFKLERTRERSGIPTYTIRLSSKSRLVPLFRGTIAVVGDLYALVGVEVTPNEAYSIPFVSNIEIAYAQQFALYERIFWMPVDIRIKAKAEIGLPGISLPPIGIEQVSSIYEYRINAAIPDSVFGKPRRIVSHEAKKYDSLFWAQREVLPLTEEEQRAYKSLDSTESLEKQFKPSGVLTVFNTPLFSCLEYVNLRFNRAEGLFLGPRIKLDSVTNQLDMRGGIGYGFSDKRAKVNLGAEVFLDSLRKYSISADVYQELGHLPDEKFFDQWEITTASLFDKNDYRDYFYAEGWRFFFNVKPTRQLTLSIGYQNEDVRSAYQRTDYSFFNRSSSYRPNPLTKEGTARSLLFSARYGNPPALLGLVAQDFVELNVEHSSPTLLASGYDFSKLTLRAEAHIKTFAQRLLFSPTLSLRASVGVSSGYLPPHQMFSLESRYSGYAPFGVLRGSSVKEFVGNRYLLLSIEHNFRSTPFLALNIPFLYKNGIELIVYGAAARMWNSSVNPLPFGGVTQGWYTEAGLGLSRIFGFFRVDCTYRFSHPRDLFVTVGVARIL